MNSFVYFLYFSPVRHIVYRMWLPMGFILLSFYYVFYFIFSTVLLFDKTLCSIKFYSHFCLFSVFNSRCLSLRNPRCTWETLRGWSRSSVASLKEELPNSRYIIKSWYLLQLTTPSPLKHCWIVLRVFGQTRFSLLMPVLSNSSPNFW